MQGSQNDALDPFPKSSYFCLDGRITNRSEFPVAGGGTSDIWNGLLGTHTVAIKTIRPFNSAGAQIQRTKLLKRLWREYLTWSRVSHPNILACLGFTYDFMPGGDLPALISSWMSNGDVNSYIRTYPGVDRFKLILGIADGLSYLHNQNPAIVHGDLRAGNVLVSENGVPHLTDFGVSKILDVTWGMTTSSDPAGAMRWMAPELFSGAKVSVNSDVWAYGMTVLEIFSGARPYDNLSDLMVFCQIMKGEIPSRPATVTDALWTVFQECCKLQPENRPSMHEVIRYLNELPPFDAGALGIPPVYAAGNATSGGGSFGLINPVAPSASRAPPSPSALITSEDSPPPPPVIIPKDGSPSPPTDLYQPRATFHAPPSPLGLVISEARSPSPLANWYRPSRYSSPAAGLHQSSRSPSPPANLHRPSRSPSPPANLYQPSRSPTPRTTFHAPPSPLEIIIHEARSPSPPADLHQPSSSPSPSANSHQPQTFGMINLVPPDLWLEPIRHAPA